jgi:hypothetical protein
MYGPRVLEWTFNNIMLPDSTTNESESHGFLSFRVSQDKDLPNGTQINNTADIYFDFNVPVITNTTRHVINDKAVQIVVNTKSSSIKEVTTQIHPNPVNNLIHISSVHKMAHISLFDIQGR